MKLGRKGGVHLGDELGVPNEKESETPPPDNSIIFNDGAHVVFNDGSKVVFND